MNNENPQTIGEQKPDYEYMALQAIYGRNTHEFIEMKDQLSALQSERDQLKKDCELCKEIIWKNIDRSRGEETLLQLVTILANAKHWKDQELTTANKVIEICEEALTELSVPPIPDHTPIIAEKALKAIEDLKLKGKEKV